MKERDLRILSVLYENRWGHDRYRAPMKTTQKGMCAEIGMSRPAVAESMVRLEEAGLVRWHKVSSLTRGQIRAYIPTEDGMRLAEAMACSD